MLKHRHLEAEGKLVFLLLSPTVHPLSVAKWGRNVCGVSTCVRTSLMYAGVKMSSTSLKRGVKDYFIGCNTYNVKNEVKMFSC